MEATATEEEVEVEAAVTTTAETEKTESALRKEARAAASPPLETFLLLHLPLSVLLLLGGAAGLELAGADAEELLLLEVADEAAARRRSLAA